MKVNNNNLERFVNVAVLISYTTEKSVYDAKKNIRVNIWLKSVKQSD